jgi:DNA-damage-inducible protein J
MSQATMNIRIDENIKKSFDEFCGSVGLNASVAVNMFVRAVLRSRSIPFVVTDVAEARNDAFSTEALRKVLIGRILEGEETKRWVSHEDMMKEARGIVASARDLE